MLWSRFTLKKWSLLYYFFRFTKIYILILRNDLVYFHSITIFLCDPSKTNEWPILKWMLFTSFEHYVRNVNICFLRNVLSKVFYALCTRAALKIFFEEKIKDKKLIPEKILFFFNVALKLFFCSSSWSCSQKIETIVIFKVVTIRLFTVGLLPETKIL